MKEAVVYTAQNCAYCTLVMKFLKEAEIPFRIVRAEDDPTLVQMLLEKSGRMGLPQTQIGDEWIVGYQPPAIQKAWDRFRG